LVCQLKGFVENPYPFMSITVISTAAPSTTMHKRHCSVALTPELVQAVENRRGVFSFSAYLEYLCWKGLQSLEKEEKPIARRSVIRAR
jgi:hypothetical protein